MNGYKNRILRVDLSTGRFSEQSLDEQMIRDYIGGRGFGIKMLFDELKPDIDPMSEENPLIFLTGPLAGTTAQSFDRWKLFFKSPLTGGYFKSAGGGHFASELKLAGFDGIVIEGRAEKPVYLWIRDGKPELRDARYLWGLDCDDTHTLIREELHDPKIRIACIGKAGENLVKYAGVFSDRRAAGRGGGGTVMGNKNLKAVCVRGTQKLELYNLEGFRAAVKDQVRLFKGAHSFERFSTFGSQNPEFTNLLGMFPTKNFQEGVLEGWEKIERPEYTKLRVRKHRCHNCMIHCASITKVEEGKYAGSWSEGPEYETAWVFTGSIGKPEIGLTVAADKLCDDLGLDTITTGVSIGFAYELYEKGILTKADTDGLELVWGNDDPVIPLIHMIAERRGIGDILAEGVREAARRIGRGTEQYAIHVKGLELPGYDPRGAKAHGLNLMTMNIGADHNSGYAVQETHGRIHFGEQIDRFAVEGKGELCKWNQDIGAIWDTGIICSFAGILFMSVDIFARLLHEATGIPEFKDPDYLWRVGERINNLERLFNIREGFGRKDDSVPERFTRDPMPAGPSKGQVFEAEQLLADYYRVRNWDPATGAPTEEKLRELGL